MGSEYNENNGFFKSYESNKILAYGKLNENFLQIADIHKYDGEKVFGLRLKKEELVLLDTLSQKLKIFLNFNPKLGISELVEGLCISTLAYSIEKEMESICKAGIANRGGEGTTPYPPP